MTADRYQVQVLEQALFDYYWQKFGEKGQVVFQQDGRPVALCQIHDCMAQLKSP
jgi:hypothetical protein